MVKFSNKKPPGLRVFKPQPKKIKTGEFDFTIEKLSEDGRGVARPAGKATFVCGALPGEQVKGRYLAHHRQYDEAELVTVVSASEQRAKPSCEHYQDCGGCTLQHLDYLAQVGFKQQRLQALFHTLSERQPEPIRWANDITASPLHYRHRLRLAVKANKHAVKIGFRRFNSHEIIDINDCSVAQPALNQLLKGLKSCLIALKTRSAIEEIRLLEDGEGKLAVQLLVKSALIDEDYQRLKDFKRRENLRYFAVSAAKPVATKPFWFDGEALNSFQLAQPECTIGFEIEDFTQINPEINQMMISTALQWLALTKEDMVADFFCGVGNFSVPLAASGAAVVAYEVVDAMVEKGRDNALRNQLSNLTFKRQDLFQSLPKKIFSHNQHKITKALLDPPRAGAKALVEQLANEQLTKLLYISCNPQTLLRDAEILQQGGFNISQAAMIDMFPQTTHIETIMLFEKNSREVQS